MPQYGPLAFIATNTSGHPAALRADPAETAHLYLTADTVLATNAVRAGRVSVVVTGTAEPAVYDCTATADISARNQIAVVPNSVGVYLLDWPCASGLVIAAADATLAVTLA